MIRSLTWICFFAYANCALAALEEHCTEADSEQCYLHIGSVYEFRDIAVEPNPDGLVGTNNDCMRRDLMPYINAVNSLNGGKGLEVHQGGLQELTGVQYPRRYYRLNYTRLTFPKGKWEEKGKAMSEAFFPSLSFISGMGAGCPDPFTIAQAQVANASSRIFMTSRGPFTTMTQGMNLKYAFSSHLYSDLYPKSAITQFGLRGVKTAAVLYFCCSNLFFRGVGEMSVVLLEEVGIEVVVNEQLGGSPDDEVEEAIAKAISSKADVLITSLTPSVFILMLERLRERQLEYSFKSVWGVNPPWGETCMGLGPNCSHVLGASQLMTSQAGVFTDAVIGRNGTDFAANFGFDLTSVPVTFFDIEAGASAFVQAVQDVYRWNPVKGDPRNLLFDPADPDAYEKVRRRMRNGKLLGDTLSGPVSFDQLSGQNNGMSATTVQVDPDGAARVIFPEEHAELGFGFPAPAHDPCLSNFYKSWPEGSCALCHAKCTECHEDSGRVDPDIACSCVQTFYEIKPEVCTECPEGSDCSVGGSTLKSLSLHPGHWRVGSQATDVYVCKVKEACLGGSSAGDASCAEGYGGPRCELCVEGFYPNANGECLVCPASDNSDSIGSLLTSPGPLLVLAILFIALSCVFMKWRKKRMAKNQNKKEESEENAPPPNLIERAHEYYKSKATRIRILVGFFQILNMLPNILKQVKFPGNFVGLLDSVKIVNLAIFQIVPAKCANPDFNFYQVLLFQTTLPVLATLVGVAICMLHCRLSAKDNAEMRKLIKGAYYGYFLMFTFLIYPGTVNVIFQTFSCESFDMGDGTSVSYLAVDLSLDCGAPLHATWSAYGLLMIFVYVLGIPFLYAVNLWRNRHAINPDLKGDMEAAPLSVTCLKSASKSHQRVMAAKLEKRDADPSIQHLTFLYGAYRPDRAYFELIECFRKVMLTAALIFCFEGTAMQIVAGLIICLASVKTYSHLKPFAKPSESTMAESAQWSLLGIMMLTLILLIYQADPEVVGVPGFGDDMVGQLMLVMSLFSFVMSLLLDIGEAFGEDGFNELLAKITGGGEDGEAAEEAVTDNPAGAAAAGSALAVGAIAGGAAYGMSKKDQPEARATQAELGSMEGPENSL